MLAGVLSWGVLGVGAPGVFGQEGRRIEAGIEDVDDVRVSLRSLPPTFRADTGFEHVYEGEDGSVYRIAGAIHAVYGRGTYRAGPGGSVIAEPAGEVVYHLGAPDWLGGGGGGGAAGAVEGSGGGVTGVLASAPRVGAVRVGARLDGFVGGGVAVGAEGGARSDGAVASGAVTSAGVDPTGRGTMSEELTRRRRLVEIARAGLGAG